MWEEAVALADPESPAAEKGAAAAAVKADGKDVGDFHVSLYDFLLANRPASPLPDRSPWIVALLDNAIELKAGPPPAKAAEPFPPAGDAVLRRLYRDRAARKLTSGDANLDRAVADAERADAGEDLLADALGRRCRGRRPANRSSPTSTRESTPARKRTRPTPWPRSARATCCGRTTTIIPPTAARPATTTSTRPPPASNRRPTCPAGPRRLSLSSRRRRAYEDLSRLDEKAPAVTSIGPSRNSRKRPRPTRNLRGRPAASAAVGIACAGRPLPPAGRAEAGGRQPFPTMRFLLPTNVNRCSVRCSARTRAKSRPPKIWPGSIICAAMHYDRYLDGSGGDLPKAKQCCAKADDEFKAAWVAAKSKARRPARRVPCNGPCFRSTTWRVAAADDRRDAIRTRLKTLEQSALPLGGARTSGSGRWPWPAAGWPSLRASTTTR